MAEDPSVPPKRRRRKPAPLLLPFDDAAAAPVEGTAQMNEAAPLPPDAPHDEAETPVAAVEAEDPALSSAPAEPFEDVPPSPPRRRKRAKGAPAPVEAAAPPDADRGEPQSEPATAGEAEPPSEALAAPAAASPSAGLVTQGDMAEPRVVTAGTDAVPAQATPDGSAGEEEVSGKGTASAVAEAEESKVEVSAPVTEPDGSANKDHVRMHALPSEDVPAVQPADGPESLEAAGTTETTGDGPATAVLPPLGEVDEEGAPQGERKAETTQAVIALDATLSEPTAPAVPAPQAVQANPPEPPPVRAPPAKAKARPARASAMRGQKRLRIGGVEIGAAQAGALALGALAIGALAIGALAIGRLAVGRAQVRRLEVDELVIGTVKEKDKPRRR